MNDMMREIANFEKIYETYKSNNDNVIVIDGIKYFKIIEKYDVCGFQIIAIPNDVLNTAGNMLKDDLGNIFTIGNPVHYKFKDNIPEWYFETSHVMLKDTTVDKIGEYITLVQ